MKPPAFSLRKLPASIVLGLALGVIGSVTYGIAFVLESGEGYERFQATERARIFNLGCQYAQILLCSCGLFALARRHLGGARTLAQTAAWLMFVGLAWPFANLAVVITKFREPRTLFDALGLVETVVMVAATILLTLAADAWRRVLPAAIALVLLLATSYSVPVIGKLLNEVMGESKSLLRVYYVGREMAWAAGFLFVAGALAAGGQDPAPDPRRAASGFRLAHTAMMIRVIAAIALVLVGFGLRAPGTIELAIVVGPLAIIATLMMFAIGILRVDAANLPGMPRLRLALAAAGLFWFASLQLEQFLYLLGNVWNGDLEADEIEHVELFSVIGPLVTTVAIGLIGSAIATFGANRGNMVLSGAASTRTFAFVGLGLGGIALQSLMPHDATAGQAVIVTLIAVVAGIAAFVVLLGLLRTAAEQVAAEMALPPARVVSDS